MSYANQKLLLASGGYQNPERRANFVKELKDFLGTSVSEVLFIPYAIQNHDGYTTRIQELGLLAGYRLVPIHTMPDPRRAIKVSEVIFVGGGNTFRLLHELQKRDLMWYLKEAVERGTPYIGVSAGSNIACPSIKTTNDMPIVQPISFSALGLVPFQINPHFPDPDYVHQGGGETREDRIREFHEMKDTPVLGLREGGTVHVEDNHAWLDGVNTALLFRQGTTPQQYVPGDSLNFLL